MKKVSKLINRIRKKVHFSPVLILACLVALIIRVLLIYVVRKNPSADEIWSYFLIKDSLHDIWLSTFGDLHPPFYFFFLHALRAILPFDLKIIHLRLISLFFGILANFGIWYLASSVLGKRAGQVAFILGLFLPGFIWASIYARYYSFLILLAILAIIFFRRFIQNGETKYLALLVLISIVGIYTHYYFFLYDVSFLVFLLFSKKYRVFIKKWIMSLVLVCFSLLPGLFFLLTLPKPEFAGRLENYFLKIPAIVVTNITSWEVLLYQYYRGNFLVYLPIIGTLWLVTVLLLISGLSKWRDQARSLFLSMLLVPPVVTALVSYTIAPLLGLGSLQIFLPPMLVVLARGIEFDLKKTKIITLTFAVVAFLGLVLLFDSSTVYREPPRDYRFLIKEFKGGDLVLHSHLYSLLISRYYLGDGVNFAIADTLSASPPTQKSLGYQIISHDTVLAHKGRLWYFEPSFEKSGEAKKAKAWLDENFILIHEEIIPPTYGNRHEDYFRVFLYNRKLL